MGSFQCPPQYEARSEVLNESKNVGYLFLYQKIVGGGLNGPAVVRLVFLQAAVAHWSFARWL